MPAVKSNERVHLALSRILKLTKLCPCDGIPVVRHMERGACHMLMTIFGGHSVPCVARQPEK